MSNAPNIQQGGQPQFKKKVCMYYQQGKCRKGDDCDFLHTNDNNQNNTNNTNNSNNMNNYNNSNDNAYSNNVNICSFFLKGHCKNDTNCK